MASEKLYRNSLKCYYDRLQVEKKYVAIIMIMVMIIIIIIKLQLKT